MRCISRTKIYSLALLLFYLLSSVSVFADIEDKRERASKAAEILNEILKAPDRGIPKELLKEAHAIAVIPHVLKGAFGIGGRYGKGLLSKKTHVGKWSAPSYVDLSGASFGFQIGVAATDLVLVFANADGLKSLLDGKVKLGADASVAAGPVGRTGEASTDIKLNASIYSYSRSKGLFAGVALEGAVLSIDDSANHEVYGPNVSGTDILLQEKIKPNAVVRPFVAALTKHMP